MCRQSRFSRSSLLRGAAVAVNSSSEPYLAGSGLWQAKIVSFNSIRLSSPVSRLPISGICSFTLRRSAKLFCSGLFGLN